MLVVITALQLAMVFRGLHHHESVCLLEASDQAFKDITYDFKQVEEAGVINGIEKEINEFGADLLVMVPHKLNVWESLLNQSTTRSMCLRTTIPLLVLPNAKTSQDN